MSEIDSGVATTEEVSDCESTTEKDRYNIQQGYTINRHFAVLL